MIRKAHVKVSRRRLGFTLTELLVVIFILAVIAGLFAYFMPGFDQHSRASQGANSLANQLLLVRQNALRDQAPRGLRLFVDSNNPQFITSFQYLEQPDDFTGGQISSVANDATKLQFTGVDLYGGFGPNDPTVWPVQPGDYIQVNNVGLMHQINRNPDPTKYAVTDIVQTGAMTFQVQLVSALTIPITTPQSNYKIVRKPRLQGDEPITLPFSVGIDWTTNQTYGKLPMPLLNAQGQPTGDPIDIMFAPSGAVMNYAGVDKMYFWVRDDSYSNPFDGNPSLVVLYIPTGLTAGYDVDLTADPRKPNPSPSPYTNVK
jgi:prepilin-type N-terminal cleavage/methylation domain-containing protein